MKMKRKETDRVNDEFSVFSHSSPATKIRRLEEETQSVVALVKEERATVLYKLLQPYQSSTGNNIFVDRDLISRLKNRILQNARVADDDFHDEEDEKNQDVVPWDPSWFQSLEEPSKPEIYELDGEDAMMEEAAMDVEEEKGNKSNIISLPLQQQQWLQQQLHCMIPQLPQTNSTPISTPISWFQ